MLDDQQFEAIWGGFRDELQQDVVGIWMLAGDVRRVIDGLDEAGVREAVLTVIDRALRAGEAEAVGPGNTDLQETWRLRPEETRAGIEREWIALGREPMIGEVLWLQKVGGYPPIPPEVRARNEATFARLRTRLAVRRAWHEWWAERGCHELTELLWSHWDPIGFDSEAGRYKPPRDEYASYSKRLGPQLRDGATAEQVDQFLDQVVATEMRLDARLDGKRIGQQIVEWHARAQPQLDG